MSKNKNNVCHVIKLWEHRQIQKRKTTADNISTQKYLTGTSAYSQVIGHASGTAKWFYWRLRFRRGKCPGQDQRSLLTLNQACLPGVNVVVKWGWRDCHEPGRAQHQRSMVTASGWQAANIQTGSRLWPGVWGRASLPAGGDYSCSALFSQIPDWSTEQVKTETKGQGFRMEIQVQDQWQKFGV